MSKSTVTYWNALNKNNNDKWEVIEGSDGQLEQLTLAIDEQNGDYTRLTRFKAGANTKAFGAKIHDFLEEIMIIKGRLYDEAFDKWLELGDYASRPPGEVHGPFVAEKECIVLEISYPSQSR
ncbi:MAG: cupin domain-containing protein [Gammaproteobacteria bacterium]|nr:cupin domain-containing protein [Gammaproteobacteria bacterium]MCF6362688.1 cupin domain-containing protein [Gammaproteobacteria bacterium]